MASPISWFLKNYGVGVAFASAGWIFIATFALTPKFAVANVVVVGTGYFLLGIALLVERLAVMRRAIFTDGAVVKTVEVFVNRYTIKHAPRVRFVDRNGSDVEFTDHAILRATPHAAGARLAVLYDPKDSTHAYVAKPGRLFTAPFGLMIVGALVIGIGIYWYPRLVFN